MKTREELLADVWQPDEDVNIGKFVIPDSKLGKILSAPTKAQMECPYCHDELGVPKSKKEYVHDVKAIGKGVYKESYLNDIKHCDVCGRKFGDE